MSYSSFLTNQIVKSAKNLAGGGKATFFYLFLTAKNSFFIRFLGIYSRVQLIFPTGIMSRTAGKMKIPTGIMSRTTEKMKIPTGIMSRTTEIMKIPTEIMSRTVGKMKIPTGIFSRIVVPGIRTSAFLLKYHVKTQF